jgi:aminoglycoside/choline kinase family phosphotransferase
MTDRIAQFLAQSRWATWHRTQLAGDASTRQYERLTHQDSSVILMDAPPENGEDTKKFSNIAEYLTINGLCPPAVLAHDQQGGIMILSDLGPDHYARWITQQPNESYTLYQAAVDVLLHLQTCDPPVSLMPMTPKVGAEMISVAAEYYADRPATDLIDEMKIALHQLASEADTLALRDFHAENLIWRPQFSELARVGLLDFQDAFIAPSGYDLASLLRDVRRDVEPKLAEEMITYFMEKGGLDGGFRAQLACLGAQRNLRILGVFARLATQMNKKRYVALIPRVWSNLQHDLAHPALGKLQQAVLDTLPVPDKAFLERLSR